MSWTDKELDELFKGAAEEQSFEYRKEYFNDIEGQLPVRKRRVGLLWWGGGFLSLLGLIVLMINTPDVEDRKYSSVTTPVESSAKGFTSIEQQLKRIPNAKGSTFAVGDRSDDIRQVPNKLIAGENASEFALVEDLSYKTDLVDDGVSRVAENIPFDVEKLEPKNLCLPVSGNIIKRDFHLSSQRVKGISFYAELSAGAGQSPVKDSELGSSMSYTYGISAGAEYRFNKWSVSGGLGVARRHFENVYIQERSVIYGFGVNNFDNQYNFNSLISLEIPLRLGYRFGDHLVEGGVTTSCALLTTVHYQEQMDGETLRQGSGIAGSHMFDRVVVRPELRYAFRLSNNWTLGAGVSMQVGSGIASDRIKGDQQSMPLSGTVSIKRSFEFH